MSTTYCYNTEGDRNTVVNQESCRMDVTLLEQRAYVKIAVLPGRNDRVPYGRRLFPTASTSSLTFSRSTAILMWACCSHPFCTTIDLQLSLYRPLCYNSRAHCSLLQCLRITSAILASTHSYFVISSFKCEGKNS